MNTNFGSILYDIVMALVDFTRNFKNTLTQQIDISKINDLLATFNITSSLPNTISILPLIGALGTVLILAIILLKIIL